jgi:FkbM family methyltransferase
MEIKLNLMNAGEMDIANSPDLLEYYNNGSSFTKHIIEKEINNGHYNDVDFKKIFDNNDAVVVDGGANIGLFSLHLHKACKKIYAVEPTTRHLNVLRNICKQFNINNVKFSEVAFNNYTGQVYFMTDEGNTTQNRIANYGTPVNCVTILEYLRATQEPVIDLLKIDIEGGEHFAMLNDPTFNDVAKICNNIYVEIHPPFVNPADIVNKLVSMNYKVKFMNSQFLNNNLNVLAYK